MAKKRQTPQSPAVEPAHAEAEPPRRERAPLRQTLGLWAVLAGCGGATALLLSGWTPGPGAPRPSTVITAARPSVTAPRTPLRSPARTATQAAPAESSGLAVFSNECGICHTLAAAATTGRAGPNLDRLHPSVARVVTAIRNGGRGSGLMPRNALVGADVGRVARFVARSARR